jgi:hypothetical protein
VVKRVGGREGGREGVGVSGFNCHFVRVQPDSARAIHFVRANIADTALYHACPCTDNESADLW